MECKTIASLNCFSLCSSLHDWLRRKLIWQLLLDWCQTWAMSFTHYWNQTCLLKDIHLLARCKLQCESAPIAGCGQQGRPTKHFLQKDFLIAICIKVPICSDRRMWAMRSTERKFPSTNWKVKEVCGVAFCWAKVKLETFQKRKLFRTRGERTKQGGSCRQTLHFKCCFLASCLQIQLFELL